MRNMITLPDGTQAWPKYPRWRYEMKGMGIPKPNRSRRARGKLRLLFNPLYAADREAKAAYHQVVETNLG